MIRRRQLLMLAALACAGSLTWGVAQRAACEGGAAARDTAPGSAGQPGTGPHAAAQHTAAFAAGQVVASHKPGGPVALQLVPGEVTARGQSVLVSLRPVRTLTAVSWRWELSPGVTLVTGSASGSADPRADVPSDVSCILLPLREGRQGSASLVVEAQFEGADTTGPTGPETTIQAVALRWGPDDPPPVPLVPGFDAAGEPTVFAVLPSIDQAGH